MARHVSTISDEMDAVREKYHKVICKHYGRKDLQHVLSIIQAGGDWNFCDEVQKAAEVCRNKMKELINERYIAKGIM